MTNKERESMKRFIGIENTENTYFQSRKERLMVDSYHIAKGSEWERERGRLCELNSQLIVLASWDKCNLNSLLPPRRYALEGLSSVITARATLGMRVLSEVLDRLRLLQVLLQIGRNRSVEDEMLLRR